MRQRIPRLRPVGDLESAQMPRYSRCVDDFLATTLSFLYITFLMKYHIDIRGDLRASSKGKFKAK
jgi:hypothetical protein